MKAVIYSILTGARLENPDIEHPVDNFKQVQQEIDHSQWVGRGAMYYLGGDYNDPHHECKPEAHDEQAEE